MTIFKDSALRQICLYTVYGLKLKCEVTNQLIETKKCYILHRVQIRIEDFHTIRQIFETLCVNGGTITTTTRRNEETEIIYSLSRESNPDFVAWPRLGPSWRKVCL